MDHPAGLEAMLRLEALAGSTFRSRHSVANINGRVFGGQMLGQALWAAGQTVGDRLPAQLHFTFGNGGSLDTPLTYTVETVQQGRRFSIRRTGVHQEGRMIGTATMSFQVPMEGPRHQPVCPVVPDPETLPSTAELRDRFAAYPSFKYVFSQSMRLADLRPIELENLLDPKPDAHLRYWLRFTAPLTEDPLLHYAALTFASDLWLAFVGVMPHIGLGETQRYYFAALSHSIWFHHPFRADEWLLVDAVSPSAGNGQSVVDAKVFNRAGLQVATVVQSALMAEMQPG